MTSRYRYVDLVQALRFARVLAGLSQSDVARALGPAVRQQHVSRWESCADNGKRSPRVLTLLRWAEIVGVRL